MTTEVTTCPRCHSESQPGEHFCTRCGEALLAVGKWPTWRTAEAGNTFARDGEHVVEGERTEPERAETSEPDFVPLAIDPIPEGRPWLGPRLARLTIPLAILALIVIWIIAERMLATDHSWAHWDIVWYIAGALTLVLTGGLAVVLWMQAQARGSWSKAFAWLLS